ncbi:MAG: hypothetical protein ACOC3B_02355 [Bacillota bacterium]
MLSGQEKINWNFKWNCLQGASQVEAGDEWKAVIHLYDGDIIKKQERCS